MSTVQLFDIISEVLNSRDNTIYVKFVVTILINPVESIVLCQQVQLFEKYNILSPVWQKKINSFNTLPLPFSLYVISFVN
jgi:hypothetical protein